MRPFRWILVALLTLLAVFGWLAGAAKDAVLLMLLALVVKP